MTIDVFLMGTAGNRSDPNFDNWREPIIDALSKRGFTAFDPVVDVWDEAADAAEKIAFKEARVLAMAIRVSTEGYGSLAETGWAALSATLQDRPFILCVQMFSNELHPLAKELNRPRKLVLSRYEDLASVTRHVLVVDDWVQFRSAILHAVIQKNFDARQTREFIRAK